MRNVYSKPLYDLYKKARDWRDNFRKSIDYLVEDESGIDQFEQGLMGSDDPFSVHLPTINISKTNIRDFKDKELRDAYTALQDFRNSWRSNVEGILQKIPQISFTMRFDDPKIDRKMGIRTDFMNYDFSHDMDMFLDLFDAFDDEVDELYNIIIDYEKSIYEPNDFEPEQDKNDDSQKDIAYRLRYESVSGKLFVNGYGVYKCNLESTLDKALQNAFKANDFTAKTKGNLASTKSKIRIPEGLRNLMISAGKGTFRIKPVITNNDLSKAGLNKADIEKEFQNINNS